MLLAIREPWQGQPSLTSSLALAVKTFFALEPRWFGRDRFYKVYLTDRDLRGALIGRQVYDEDSARRQMIAPAQIFAPLMKLWADRILQKVQQRERDYDGSVLSSDVFLRQDRLNFLIGRGDILDIRVNRKKRLWTGYSKIAGTLRLKIRGGSQREWIIVGEQDMEAILTALGFPESSGAAPVVRRSPHSP